MGVSNPLPTLLGLFPPYGGKGGLGGREWSFLRQMRVRRAGMEFSEANEG